MESHDLKELCEDDDNIQELLLTRELTVLYFTASWCGPCKKVYPSLCKLNKEIDRLTIYKLDIDKNDDIVDRNKVSSVPYFQIYSYGQFLGDCKGSDIQQIGHLLVNAVKSLKR